MTDRDVARAIQTKRIAENPLVAPDTAYFPDRCLSHGLARWCFDSALALTDDSYDRIGMEPDYQYVRRSLDPG